MLIFGICISGRVTNAMLLYASPRVVGTTQPRCSGSYECPVAGDSSLTQWVQRTTKTTCEKSTTHV